MMQPKRNLIICTLLILLLAALPAAAQETTGITLQASGGFDSFYKSDTWTPITTVATNSGPSLEGTLQVTIGSSAGNNRMLVYQAPISLPTQSNKQITLYVHLIGFVNDLEVKLLNERGDVVATAVVDSLSRLDKEDLLYGVISPEPAKLSFLEAITGSSGRAGVAFLNPADLPTVPAAWRALDVLVISDSDTTTLTSSQLETLRGWVQTGGQLVITGGPGWQAAAAAFTDLLPVAVNTTTSTDDIPALREAAGLPFRDNGPYLLADSTLLSGGELLLHQDGQPLLARRDFGRGAVYFLALDPALAPLRDWDGNAALWQLVADRIPPLPRWASGMQNTWSATSAVSRLPALALPSVLLLMLFLAIYTVVMGPLNYVVLKRRNKLEMSWITIPVLVVAFTAVTYFAGFQIRGNTIILNQMSVAYGEANSEQMRTQTLLGLYSPRRQRYELVLPLESAVRPFSADFINTYQGTITRGTNLILEDIQSDIGEVSTFIAEGNIPQPDIDGDVRLVTNDGNLEIILTIRNNSDVLLESASILVAGSVIGLGDIPPGESVTQSAAYTGTMLTPKPAPAGSVPLFAPTTATTTPLTNNASIILGSPDYYDDRELYPRWELLQALENGPTGSSTSQASTDVATLIAWSSDIQLPIAIANEESRQRSTTLYFIDFPLERDITTSSLLTLPVGLLNWRVLEQDNVYDATIQNFYLGNGRIAFEYTLWPEFQAMDISALAIVLNSPDATYTTAPEVSLWNWSQEQWESRPEIGWGETGLPEYGRYLSPDNTVRIEINGSTTTGSYINEIYPAYTGRLDN